MCSGQPSVSRSSILNLNSAPLVPAASISFLVLLGLALGRFGNTDEAKFGPEISNNVVAALSATLPDAIRQIVGISSFDSALLSLHVSIKACLVLFVFCIASFTIRKNAARRIIFAFGLASIASVFFTTFASYYQFGIPCCERHNTVRHFLSYVAIISFSVCAADLWGKRFSVPRMQIISAALSIFFIAITVIESTRKLVPDYQNYSLWRKHHANNWLYSKIPPFVYQNYDQNGKALGLLPMPAEGRFSSQDSNTPPLNSVIIRYFGANEVVFQRKFD